MRLWLNISLCLAVGAGTTIAAQARSGGGAGGHVGGMTGAGKAMAGKPGVAPKTYEAARPLYPTSPFGPQRPGAPKTQTEALRLAQQGRGLRGGYGGGLGGYGYGAPGVYADANGYDPRLAGVPPQGFAPQYAYGYGYDERPPQLTCFRPRLIVLGARAARPSHLPKVVYGSPLPCGFKGV